jgi:Tfp pilus assembly protein PilN
MTSTMPHATAPVDRTLRTLTISVNLLPTEVVEARRARQLRRVVLASLAGFLALMGAWYGFASFQTMSARSSVASAQDEASRLLAQQNKFAKLSSVQSESRLIEGQLTGLFAEDLQWAELLAAVEKVAPAGVQISGVSGNLKSAAAGNANAAGVTALPNTSGKRIVGTITITGEASSKPAIANFVDALNSVDGLANPLLGGVNVEVGGSGATAGATHFSISADVTDAALRGRYTPATKSPTTPKGEN